MKLLGAIYLILYLSVAGAAEDKGVEIDEADLVKKNLGESAALFDEQPLKVQENLTPPTRNISLLQIQNQVLNLNLSEKELEQNESQVEE